MCRKKEIQFLFRFGLNAIKLLWCNADTQMFLACSSITENLNSKIFVFRYIHFLCVGTKYLVLLQVLFLFTSAILAANYGIASSYVDFTGSFLCCYEVEKTINNCSKFFLNLDGNMFVWVLLKLL